MVNGTDINSYSQELLKLFQQQLGDTAGAAKEFQTFIEQELGTLLSSDGNLVIDEVEKTEGTGDVTDTGDVGDVQAVIPAPVTEMTKMMTRNLEGLLAKLQITVDQKQIKFQEANLQTTQEAFEKQTAKMLEEVNIQIEQMQEAYDDAQVKKALGWLMVAVVCAVAIAVTVISGGAAGPAMAAVIKCIVCCAIAITSQVLVQTGADKAIKDWLSEDFFQGVCGMSKKDADLAASITYAVGEAIASIISMCTVMYGAKGSVEAMKAANAIMKVGTAVTAAATTAMGVVTMLAEYRAGMAAAEMTEVRASLRYMEAHLEESQKELMDLLNMLQSLMGDIFQIINSKMDAEMEIAQRMGAMA